MARSRLAARRPTVLIVALSPLALVACDDQEVASGSEDLREIQPRENWDRDVVSTDLVVDLATRTATARIVLAPGSRPGASFEVQGLDVKSVTDAAGGGFRIPCAAGSSISESRRGARSRWTSPTRSRSAAASRASPSARHQAGGG